MCILLVVGIDVYVGRHLGSQLAELENAIERMMECDFVSFFMEGLKMKLNSKERVSEEDEQATEVRIRTVAVCINCMYLVLCIVQVFPVHAVFLPELKMLSISMLGLNNLSIYVPVTLVYFYKQLCILSTMLCVCVHTFMSVCLSVCGCMCACKYTIAAGEDDCCCSWSLEAEEGTFYVFRQRRINSLY